MNAKNTNPQTQIAYKYQNRIARNNKNFKQTKTHLIPFDKSTNL